MKRLIRPATWGAARRRLPRPPSLRSPGSLRPHRRCRDRPRALRVGQAAASLSVEVRSQVTGVIVERPYVEGTDVAKGTLLFRIDPTTYEAAYRSAQARLADAERNLARLKALLGARAVAQKDVEDAQTALDQAQAAVDQTKKDYDDMFVRAQIASPAGRALLQLGAGHSLMNAGRLGTSPDD